MSSLLGLIGGIAQSAMNKQYTSELNIENAILNDKFWHKQAQTSYKLNELAADNAQQRTIDLYNLLQSPESMVKQLKAAGLNPALMYSNSGMGGSVHSGAQGGAQASAQGANTLGLQQLSNIDPLTLAQIKNIDADTDLKKADTKKTELETQTEKWSAKYTEFMAKNMELEFNFNDKSFWTKFKTLEYEMYKLQGEADTALALGKLDQETYDVLKAKREQELALLNQQEETMKILQRKYGKEIEYNEVLKKKASAEIKEINQKTKNLQEEIKVIQAEYELKIKQADSEEQRKELLEAQEAHTYRLIQNEIDKYNWETISKEDAKWLIEQGVEIGKIFSGNKNNGMFIKALKALKK